MPVLEDDHAVGQHHRIHRIVRDHHHGTREVGEVAAQERAHGCPRARIQCSQRLVEEQQIGIGDKGARERDPLRLATGEPTWPAVGEITDLQSIEPLACARLGHLAGFPACAQAEGDVVEHRHMGKEQVVLEDEAHRALLGRQVDSAIGVHDGHSRDVDPSGLRRLESGEAAQGCRLARAVGAEQADGVAVSGIE